MAERRMFAKTIIDSDAFLDMPLSSQALYFHLSMRADDEGFINNPKKIQRVIGSSEDDLKLLAAKSFILPFESGVVVIKHWKMHNYIRADRIKETVYQEEKELLGVRKNGSYTISNKIKMLEEIQVADTWQAVGRQLADECPHRLGKVRLGKVSIDKDVDNNISSKYPVDSFERKCVDYLIKKILEEMTNAKVPKTDIQKDKWCGHIEKMMRLDKRTEKDIEKVLEFATSNPFWKANIRSTAKLREKYETLFMQMKNKKDGTIKNKTTNKFNQFPQREYTEQQMSEIEKKIINRGLE